MRACGKGAFNLEHLKIALVLVANKVFNSVSDENIYILLEEFILPLIGLKHQEDEIPEESPQYEEEEVDGNEGNNDVDEEGSIF
jgi:hypothetical protein